MPHSRTCSATFLASGHSSGVPRALQKVCCQCLECGAHDLRTLTYSRPISRQRADARAADAAYSLAGCKMSQSWWQRHEGCWVSKLSVMMVSYGIRRCRSSICDPKLSHRDQAGPTMLDSGDVRCDAVRCGAMCRSRLPIRSSVSSTCDNPSRLNVHSRTAMRCGRANNRACLQIEMGQAGADDDASRELFFPFSEAYAEALRQLKPRTSPGATSYAESTTSIGL